MASLPTHFVGLLLTISFSGFGPRIEAQARSDPPIVDSLVIAMDGVSGLELDKTAINRCGPLGGQITRLCRALVYLARAEQAGGGTGNITDAIVELEEVVRREPDWAAGWYLLGVVRLRAADLDLTAKPGPLQPLGRSLVAGAGDALARAVGLAPEFQRAIDALALAPVPREGASALDERVAELHQVRDRLSPLAMVGAARIERAVGHREESAALLERALATGAVDSGVVMIQLARELHAIGQYREGRQALFAGAGIPSEASKAAYRSELEWTAEPAQLASWDSTATTDRPAWLANYWYGKDVTSGHSQGMRLEEHYRRVEYAWQQFRLTLPPSGRHKMSVRSGGIDTFVDELIKRRLTGAEGLAYANDPTKLNYELLRDTRTTYDQLDAAGAGGPLRSYRAAQDVIDDRGVVWIRYGEPDRSLRSTGGEALEVWAYDQPGQRLVVKFREENFDGQVGATVLVPTLLDVPGRFRDQFCGIVEAYCTANTDNPGYQYDDSAPLDEKSVAKLYRQTTDNGRITTATIANDIEEGKADLTRATTTDAFPPPFTAALGPIVQLHGESKSSGRYPVLLATFAIPATQLQHSQPPAAGGRTVYAIDFRLSAVDADGKWFELDTTRNFAVAAPLADGQYLRGLLQFSVPAGTYRAALRVVQDDGRGAVSAIDPVVVPTSTGGLAISSLIIGSKEGGLRWSSGTREVPINGLNAFPRGGEATLYYQVFGATPGAKYDVAIEFFETNTDADEVKLRVSFRETAKDKFIEVERAVGLDQLATGHFRVRATVSGPNGSVSTEGSLNVVKR